MCEWLHEERGCRWSEPVMQAAAATGDLDFCRWLDAKGCPLDERSLTSAAAGGHLPLCQWLLASGCGWCMSAARAAAEGGHAEVLDWLLDEQPRNRDETSSLLLASAAAGCDLPTLQCLFERLRDPAPTPAAAPPLAAEQHLNPPVPVPAPAPPAGNNFWSELRIMAGALSARTPDWRAKVAWLQGRGFALHVDCWGRAGLGQAGWLDHLGELRDMGLALDARMAVAAARAGNVGAMEYLLGEGGVLLDGSMARHLVQEAVRHGRMPMLQALHARGCLQHGDPDGEAAGRFIQMAASRGHGEVLRWLVETLATAGPPPPPDAPAAAPAAAAIAEGAAAGDGGGLGQGAGGGVQLTADVAAAAAGSGNLELMVWLRARGCAWDAAAFAAAAEWGSVAMLEWMAAEGCPMGDKGEAYVRAGRSGDLATLRCLRRLGVPFSPTGGTFTRAVGCGCGLPVLRWLHGQGCPVDWCKAVKEARHGWRKESEVLEWIRTQRRAAGLIGGGYVWRSQAAAAWAERLREAAAAQVRRLRQLLAAATGSRVAT